MASNFTSACLQCMMQFAVWAAIASFWMAITVILTVLVHPFVGIAFSFIFFFFIPFLNTAMVTGCERLCGRLSLPLHNNSSTQPASVAADAPGPQQPTSEEPTRARYASLLVRRKIQGDDPPITCVICLDDLVVGEEAAGAPNKDCIHEFHPPCISEALMTKTTCPSCAREFFVLDP